MKQHKFIFDVDGTLTPSRQQIDGDFAVFFSTFCAENDVYLVTGSDRKKTIEQVGEEIYSLCKRVYNCSGSDVWKGSKNIDQNDWKIPHSAKTWLEEKLEESAFKIRTGNHIEERTGMVNFSIVGRNATQEQREQYVKYDKLHNERTYIAELFNREFDYLEARPGGDTGIDIAPIGADKSQILKDFDENNFIHFFGDRMDAGGNDEPLARAIKRGQTYHVKSWKDTQDKLKNLNKV